MIAGNLFIAVSKQIFRKINSKMKSKIRITIICITTVILIGNAPINITAQAATGGNFRLDQSVIVSGGGVSTDNGGNLYPIVGTIGQPIAGTTSTNASFIIRGVFLTLEELVVTAATASVEGRILTPEGFGLRKA